jgi:hypothetical protein
MGGMDHECACCSMLYQIMHKWMFRHHHLGIHHRKSTGNKLFVCEKCQFVEEGNNN